MAVHNATWTDEEVALLVKLSAEGVTSSKIAAQLPGKSRSAVIGRANRMGLASSYGPRRGAPKPKLPARPQGRPPTRPTGTHLPGHNRSRRKSGPAYSRPLAADEPTSSGYSLLDLRPGQCRWPHGDGPFVFCGHPVDLTGRQPYCDYHRAVSYRPRTTND